MYRLLHAGYTVIPVKPSLRKDENTRSVFFCATHFRATEGEGKILPFTGPGIFTASMVWKPGQMRHALLQPGTLRDPCHVTGNTGQQQFRGW